MSRTTDLLARTVDFLTSMFGEDIHLTIFGLRFSWTGWEKKEEKMGRYEFFTDAEVSGLQDSTCLKLSVARGIAQLPFVITSGLRTPTENSQLTESVKDSSHLTGNAVDLACPDSSARFAMLKGLIQAGFTRIGIYSRHIHADDSPSLPPNVCWYSNGT